MVKVLLTSVYKPFGRDNDVSSRRILPELFEGQITFAQSIFSMRSVDYTWGLDLIAANIKAPTKVMQYPSLKKFTKEIKKGYDYVGINFVVATLGKTKIMIKKIRKFSPHTKIILGGYGVVNPEAEKIADYVCHEEGITFMRRLLNESGELDQLIFPSEECKYYIMGFPMYSRTVMTLSLGCPNGCDFCCTSHFYNKKRISFIKDAKTLYNLILSIEKKSGITNILFVDEDFLLQKELITELSKYLSTREKNPFTFSCFASVKAISMYTPEELVRLGITAIWIGVESKHANFDKLKGKDIHKLFSSLQNVGINILGSFIVGLLQHDEKLLMEDFEDFISLRPNLSQFLISTPSRGTPLYAQLEKEGRLFKDSPNKNADGFNLIFDHPNFTPERLSKLQMLFYKEDYERLGPSVFRFIETQLKGFRNLKDSSDPLLRARAKYYQGLCKSIYPLISTGIRYAPNEKIRKWIKGISHELYREFDKPSIADGIKLVIISLKAYYCWKTRKKVRLTNPKTAINKYRM